MTRINIDETHAQTSLNSTIYVPGSIKVKAPTDNENSSVALDVPAQQRLGEKIIGDVVVGTGVTFAVAPSLTVVDKAIVQSAAGTHTLLKSAFESVQGMFLHPIKYVKSPTFLLMWGVYAATYSTANSLKTLVEHQEYANAAKQSSSSDMGKLGVFLGTTCVNSGVSMLKDQAYAKMFGANNIQASIPRMTYAVWMARDLSVVGSSFILPDMVYPHLVEKYGMESNQARSFCQLALPMGAQLVAGPLHYLGLDLYNRNLGKKSWSEAVLDRSKSLHRGFAPVVTARIARIFPGYGFGGVLNSKLRDGWRDYLVQREVKKMMTSEPTKENASRLVALVHSKNKKTRNHPTRRDQSIL
jgi:hypothetical protein